MLPVLRTYVLLLLCAHALQGHVSSYCYLLLLSYTFVLALLGTTYLYVSSYYFLVLPTSTCVLLLPTYMCALPLSVRTRIIATCVLVLPTPNVSSLLMCPPSYYLPIYVSS